MRGFSLIEMIIFMVVIAIVITTVVLPIVQGMPDHAKQYNAIVAVELAQERMELILASRRNLGYASLADLCVSTPSAENCTAPTGFTVTATITTSGSQKNISVVVSGDGDATLNAFVTSY